MSIYRTSLHKGFMGLIAILLTALLIAWWALYYSPLASMETAGDPKKSTGFQTIEDAKEIKNMMESRDASLLGD